MNVILPFIGGIVMFKMMANLPREKVSITKRDNVIIEDVEALIIGSDILIEDATIKIEEDDIINRVLPNGLEEYYLVIDNGYKSAIGSFSAHYQVKTKKITDQPMRSNKTVANHLSKLTFKDKAIMEKLFDMETGYVLNLNNNQFSMLIAECANIDVYTDQKYVTESSKAKKLRKFWDTEDDTSVGRVILELIGIREDIIKRRIDNDDKYIDIYVDDAIKIKRIATEMVNGIQMFSSNEERLEADLSTANSVLQDLLWIGGRVCTNVAYNKSTEEDNINDYFRDMLCSRGYNETKDQSRHGFSTSGKRSGEVDILITKDGKEIAIFEGLKLNSVCEKTINEHIDKAINNYNALGTATFIVAYVTASNYVNFWKKYYNYISTYPYNIVVKTEMTELISTNASTKVARIILAKDGFDFPVYFICFKIS